MLIMSASISEDVINLVKELIGLISGFKPTEEAFKHIEKNIHSHIRSADSMFFTTERELERIIDSLSNKFMFHGLVAQARDLKRFYQKLTPDDLSEQERVSRLNVIKFLLGVSESPTNNIHKYRQKFDKGDVEDIIDWPQYLTEGIPRWSPPPDDDSSDCWSDKSSDGSALEDKDVADVGSASEFHATSQVVDNPDWLLIYHDSKASLLANVQSRWFFHDRVYLRPTSDDKEANVALLWDDFVHCTTGGLIPEQNSNIVTEYKVMREVLWQLYEPHSSSCFQFVGNALVPKLNITISSVRIDAFQTFMGEFVPYIEWLQTLREFHESLVNEHDRAGVMAPDTYRSYDYGVQTIIRPIFDALRAIEHQIQTQETTNTLLTLAHKIRPLFRTIKILRDIHEKVILDINENSALHCATTLLARLYEGLLYTSSKLEQDLYLTLYLHSLYKYFTIIHSWLSQDILEDHAEEFVVVDENPREPHVLFNCSLARAKSQTLSVCPDSSKTQRGEQDWQMEFAVKVLDDKVGSNPLISLMCTQVLQIGKNIHLLRLLGKLHHVPEFTGLHKETFYEAYVRKILENVSVYFDTTKEIDEALEDCKVGPESPPPTFVFPATCPDECKYFTEMDRLENLVDTSNGFLVKAFESYFVKKPDTKREQVEETLYERIVKLTNLFPVQQMMEHVFVEILRERYSMSGFMVKNVLINDYDLEKQFSFLKAVFLFQDDLIFPLYRRIFQQLDSDGVWGNCTWLTSYLQDIIMDAYPNFYKECSVEVRDNWQFCTDPLKACGMINVQYRIHWPVNIIIRDEHMNMYRDLFQFILKIKWALYTLNHLYFTELEPKGKPAKFQHKSLRKPIAKLKTLRFGLINIFSSIQHYIFGHIFSKFSLLFEKEFEQAYDLESLLKAHADFVQALHKTCCTFQEYNSSSYGFYLLLYLVRKLRKMWKSLSDINDSELEKCEKLYLLCHKCIDRVINPTGYLAYTSDD